jgi:hypothetical protein
MKQAGGPGSELTTTSQSKGPARLVVEGSYTECRADFIGPASSRVWCEISGPNVLRV